MTLSQTGLYQNKHITLCEQNSFQDLGLTVEDLMLAAGAAAFAILKTRYPTIRKVVVFCGAGNNAGDGYVLARLAKESGYVVFINQYKTSDFLSPLVAKMYLAAIDVGVCCQGLLDPIPVDTQLVVDALLGAGLKGSVRGPLVDAINKINSSKLPVLALDLPSGLNADTGLTCGICVKASITVTFIALKLGLMTLDGPDYCGDLICHDLNLSGCLSGIPPAANLLDEDLASFLSAPRPRNSHKGSFGHVLIIGAGVGMPGGVCLSALAAMRIGAGLVTIAAIAKPPCVLPLIPEVLIYNIQEVSDLLPLLEKASVCVIGPGLGKNALARELLQQVLGFKLPLIIDACALHLLAESPQKNNNWILTPHPGEAAHLLDCSIADIQADRLFATTQLQAKYGGNILLKGVGSILHTEDNFVYLCNKGNPGMSCAGMGDVLCGVIAGLKAQGLSSSQALKFGVWLHSVAGDACAAKMGERGMLASDLMPYLQRLVNANTFVT